MMLLIKTAYYLACYCLTPENGKEFRPRNVFRSCFLILLKRL